jgi:hypothetical protein
VVAIMEVLIGLVFQVAIKPLLHLLDQGILLVNSALDLLDIHSTNRVTTSWAIGEWHY